jgi:hypothetical protein
MNPLISHSVFQRCVHYLMLFYQAFAFKGWRNDEKLPMVPATREISHFDGGARERLL